MNHLEQEHCLSDSINELESINKKLSKLILRKEELTDFIIGALGHDKEGQKTYEYETWKIEVKTPFIYSLNKKRYESGDYQFPEEFNPIKESVSYSIDKKVCEEAMECAPEWVREGLFELIERRAGKPSVTLKERV